MTKSIILKVSLIIAILVIDLLSKFFLYGTYGSVIPYIIGIRDAHGLNTGGAWGILGGSMWLLVLFTFVFLVGVVVLEIKWKNFHPLYSVSLSLIVGGAVGNLIDRLFLGGVRDFLYFEFWSSFPTFNFADTALCVGLFLMAIYMLFIYKSSSSNRKV